MALYPLPEIPDRRVGVAPKSGFEPAPLPDVQDGARTGQHFLNGKWMPDVDSSEIGPDNFYLMQNLRYGDGGPAGVAGYTYRTSSTSPFV